MGGNRRKRYWAGRGERINQRNDCKKKEKKKEKEKEKEKQKKSNPEKRTWLVQRLGLQKIVIIII